MQWLPSSLRPSEVAFVYDHTAADPRIRSAVTGHAAPTNSPLCSGSRSTQASSHSFQRLAHGLVGEFLDQTQRHEAVRQEPQGPAGVARGSLAARERDEVRFQVTVQFPRLHVGRRPGPEKPSSTNRSRTRITVQRPTSKAARRPHRSSPDVIRLVGFQENPGVVKARAAALPFVTSAVNCSHS